MKGKIPNVWRLQPQKAWSEIAALQLPSLPGQGAPQTQTGSDLDTQSQGDPGYTHASNTSIASAANANQESDRKRDYICTWGAEEAGHCERLLAFWRGGVYRKPDLVLQWDSLKAGGRWGLRCVGQGLQAQLLCQQGEKIEGTVCSH